MSLWCPCPFTSHWHRDPQLLPNPCSCLSLGITGKRGTGLMWIGGGTLEPGQGLSLLNKSNKFGNFFRGIRSWSCLQPLLVQKQWDQDRAEQDFSVRSLVQCLLHPWDILSPTSAFPKIRMEWNSSLLSSLSPLEGSSTLCNAPAAHNPPKICPAGHPPPTLVPKGGHRCPRGALESRASLPKKEHK